MKKNNFNHIKGDFPVSPMVKPLPSNRGGMDLIPSQGAKIPHAWRARNQNIKQKHTVINSVKTKNCPPQNKKILLKKKNPSN